MCNQQEFESWQPKAQRKATPAVMSILKFYREDVDDVLQEAAIKAWTHLDTFKSDAKFDTWYTSIAINTALMRLRHRKSRDRLIAWDIPEETLSRLPSRGKNPEQLAMETEWQEKLDAAIKTLPRSYRLAILRYLRGVKNANGTDKTQRHRAREMVRNKMTDWM